ncbi:MAG: hypothetical protein FD181_1357 [Prolixibacteraceae bacterium]|nr:MAG: hypothetical protein FD181_1357 [Prolixibacteraceae bacterium]
MFSGFKGNVGIEYEGRTLPEKEKIELLQPKIYWKKFLHNCKKYIQH